MALLAYIAILLQTILLTLVQVPFTFAQEMKSTNFKIQGGNFNITSGNKSSVNYKLSDVVGQTASIIFTSKGYIIQSGFLNTAAGEVIAFSINPSTIDFGTLIPNNPVEKDLSIFIGNGNVPGYKVTVSEAHPLATTVGSEIADTVCDNPSNPCTYTKATAWTGSTSYGFGYRVKGTTVSSDFSSDTFYRPFPSTKRSDQAATIMESSLKKALDKATMSLRVVINHDQPVGLYSTNIIFTAIPGI